MRNVRGVGGTRCDEKDVQFLDYTVFGGRSTRQNPPDADGGTIRRDFWRLQNLPRNALQGIRHSITLFDDGHGVDDVELDIDFGEILYTACHQAVGKVQPLAQVFAILCQVLECNFGPMRLERIFDVSLDGPRYFI